MNGYNYGANSGAVGAEHAISASFPDSVNEFMVGSNNQFFGSFPQMQDEISNSQHTSYTPFKRIKNLTTPYKEYHMPETPAMLKNTSNLYSLPQS